MNPHASQRASLFQFFSSAKYHSRLVRQMTKRDVVGRYRGSLIGIGWSFLHPLLMLAVFTFVFSVVFQTKWGVPIEGQEEGKGVFAVVLFVGLIMHSFLSEVLTRSPTLILSNVNYVKKVIFPLELMPWIAVLSALIHACISLAVWCVAYLVLIGIPGWQIIYMPLVMLPLVTLALGVAYLLASLGVFLRDIAQTMGILSSVLLFLSPVFFPIERLPEVYQKLFLANPLTFIIQQARDVLIWRTPPDFEGLFVYMSAATIVFCIGFGWFQKTRQGFADVL
ncbi:ABC transporter permease [Marinobacter goseongensis]|uniref:ABC transporter permease n=1 Tax=Marinobacter goseongensis TaxID=453838 RepID=UPI0020031356|nr:ABC transporter permease [Marinobacter goseongensis]MCK7551574.1 ABC transporter permease [Marinobacter goseongensis]